MLKKSFKNSSGKTSTILLVLAVALIIVIIIVFLVIRATAIQKAATASSKPAASNQPPPPVYQTAIGDVQFTFESAQDLGSVIKSNGRIYNQTLTTTERFIKVIVGAQNEGKLDIAQGSWGLGNIVDSAGRNFISINPTASSFLPSPNLCGALLKPAFTPTPCVGLYEVSKESTGLKIGVDYTQSGQKKKEAYLDLVVN